MTVKATLFRQGSKALKNCQYEGCAALKRQDPGEGPGDRLISGPVQFRQSYLQQQSAQSLLQQSQQTCSWQQHVAEAAIVMAGVKTSGMTSRAARRKRVMGPPAHNVLNAYTEREHSPCPRDFGLFRDVTGGTAGFPSGQPG
jgi:hypothetical protein